MPQRLESAQERRATRHRLTRKAVPIPIVDGACHIVGWTDVTPVFLGPVLHSPAAESLLGSEILPLYVRIENPEDAAHAGAPPGWKGGWRCLALCSGRLSSQRAEDSVPLVQSARGRR